MKMDLVNHKSFAFFILFLIAISGILSYLFSSILKGNNIDIPFYIEIPSIPTIYTLLFIFFDRYLWKLGIFKMLGIITTEDLNGKWTGYILSSYDKFSSEISAELTIKQTATAIKIKGKFNESKSISVHEDFGFSEVDQSTALFYFYRNEPNNDAVNTMAIHEGSTKLVYNKESDNLEGYYYSGRDRNNHGIINVKRQT